MNCSGRVEDVTCEGRVSGNGNGGESTEAAMYRQVVMLRETYLAEG